MELWHLRRQIHVQTDRRPRWRITVAPSAALELYWATMIGADGQFRVEHPVLQHLAEARPDLLGGLRDFWGREVDESPEVCGAAWSFPEVLVLADEADALTDDSFTSMLSAVAAVAARPAPQPRLGSESARDGRSSGSAWSRCDRMRPSVGPGSRYCSPWPPSSMSRGSRSGGW